MSVMASRVQPDRANALATAAPIPGDALQHLLD